MSTIPTSHVIASNGSVATRPWQIALCGLLWIASGCAESSGADTEPCAALFAGLQSALHDAHDEQMLTGGGVAALLAPECDIWEGATGNASDGVAMRSEHLMRIGSVTKTYVAATTLLLSAEGMLSLDDTVDTWIPSLPNAESITVRQLLEHTGGVYNYTDDVEFLAEAQGDPERAYTPQEIIEVAIAHGSSFAPGDQWGYSNTGYIALGMIIEAVTGATADAEVRERLLQPHGLEATFLPTADAPRGELATGYGANDVDVTYALHPSVAWTAGHMIATAGDLVSWARLLYNGDALPAAQREQMLQFVDTTIDGAQYGLGTVRLGPDVVGATGVGHSGGIPGFHTEMYYLPDQDVAIAVIVNSDQGDSMALLQRLVAAALESQVFAD